MTDSETTQAFPVPGEACGQCAAPLADDQRYCLNCGTRRGEPRMDPLAHLLPAAAPVPPVPPLHPEPTARSQALLGSPGLPIAGALAVLVALGGGFLIGSGGEDAPVIAQRPPVVNITSAPTGPAATATPVAADTGTESKSKESKADRRDAAKETEDEIKKAGGTILSKEQLEANKKLSPEEARKRSAKLPSVVGTGGAPPPKDDKKPGAGSDAEVIK